MGYVSGSSAHRTGKVNDSSGLSGSSVMEDKANYDQENSYDIDRSAAYRGEHYSLAKVEAEMVIGSESLKEQ